MNRDEIIAKKKEEQRISDKIFAAKLLKDIPRYHKWYAETKNPRFLEAAKIFGKMLDELYKKYAPVKEI